MASLSPPSAAGREVMNNGDSPKCSSIDFGGAGVGPVDEIGTSSMMGVISGMVGKVRSGLGGEQPDEREGDGMVSSTRTRARRAKRKAVEACNLG